eukprot:gb/GECG01007917.1/.p1 GENE.gb/GECG01007917.1/~~gb/GECG01007917.1/.p1  ORF type:complete len:412 (+),score=44.80 gb/GECG01007917.1/:1-1236(+)
MKMASKSTQNASNNGPDTEELEQEQAHFQSVLEAFSEYALWMEREVRRQELHFCQLSEAHQALLPMEAMAKKFETLREAVKRNQEFLNRVAAVNSTTMSPSQDGHVSDGSRNSAVGASQYPSKGDRVFEEPKTPFRHFDKLMHTLHACVRHWSAEGAKERACSFDPIVKELHERLDDGRPRSSKYVLVPGCGLGRLVYDIVSAGYSCQGNEFSYFMLFTGNYIMNHCQDKECETIIPWIHDASNQMKAAHMLRPVCLPDVNPKREMLATGQNAPAFSMVAGEFLKSYERQAGCWDAVVTCFFIDTAPNIIEYIETIFRLLKPGGVWINLGPLQWHWQRNDFMTSTTCMDERYYKSVELTYDEIRHAIKRCGFQFLDEATWPCEYGSNVVSLSKKIYDSIFFSVRKESASQR